MDLGTARGGDGGDGYARGSLGCCGWTEAIALVLVTPGKIWVRSLGTGAIALNQDDLGPSSGLNQNYRLIDGSFWAMAVSPWTIQAIWDTP